MREIYKHFMVLDFHFPRKSTTEMLVLCLDSNTYFLKKVGYMRYVFLKNIKIF